MSRYKKFEFGKKLCNFWNQYFPTKQDNLKQIFLKLIFFVLIVAVIASGIYFGSFYYSISYEEQVLSDARTIFHSNELLAETELQQQNKDYKAWLCLEGTKLDNPVYQTEDNQFYLTHNARKEKSTYGTLFFDYRTKADDKNRVIYGNDVSGAMFSTLKNLRSLDFYNSHSVFSLYSNGKETKYKVFAVFILNASKADDDGRIFDIYRKKFGGEDDFNMWIEDAKKRSVIESNVDVSLQDNILTFVTSNTDFENARLIVMARSERAGEELSSAHPVAKANAYPQYPKKWYDVRNIKYPF